MQGDAARNLPPFPRGQLEVVSATIKMFTEPSLHIDIERAEALAARLAMRKDDLLDEVGFDRDVLASREMFADCLRELGVDPPMTVSKKKDKVTGLPTGELTYDFRATSPAMKDLLESENEEVASLVAARLGVASTLAETRARRYAATARRCQPVPVYINWNATQSTRGSGGDSMNWNNLDRLPNRDEVTGDYERNKYGDIRKGEIRLCVQAPPAHKLIIVDLSAIEARTLAMHAGQMDLVESFRRKEDVYSKFIQPYYPNIVVSKKTPSERGVGKASILSLGYQSGEKTLKSTLALGTYGPALLVELSEAKGIKDFYRGRSKKIVDHWATAERMILALAHKARNVQWGPVTIDNGRIWLSDGTWLDYSEMQLLENPAGSYNTHSWAVRTRKGWDKLYGGKVTAHVNSALARVIMTDALKEIQAGFKGSGCKIALTVYDEIVAVTPDADAQHARDFMVEQMSRTPAWMPGLPVEAEAEISDRYTK